MITKYYIESVQGDVRRFWGGRKWRQYRSCAKEYDAAGDALRAHKAICKEGYQTSVVATNIDRDGWPIMSWDVIRVNGPINQQTSIKL